MSFLNPPFETQIKFLIYRFRFLGLYLVFGVLSLVLEFFIRAYLINLGLDHILSTLFAIFCGILFAFWVNVKFNFKIPKSRKIRAMVYFVIISCISCLLQWRLRHLLAFENMSYEWGRLLISGAIFILAYTLHRKYSFRDFKKVGVAIYANGVEDLKNIHSRIGHYPDFIHVDIVDNSMCQNAKDVQVYRLETMQAYWPNIQIQTHIMSKLPSKWIGQVLPYSDVIYIHAECHENVSELFEIIKSKGKKPGLALTLTTNIDEEIELLKQSVYVLLLTISNPGSSGQKFDMDGLERIKQINSLPFRKQFMLCVDGGVNENIVNLLDAENIVSGSSVLNNSDPRKQIMRLQTVGRYETA